MVIDRKTGRERWRYDLVAGFGAVLPNYGFAPSPLIEGRLVIVPMSRPASKWLLVRQREGRAQVERARREEAGVLVCYRGDDWRRAAVIVFAGEEIYGVAPADGAVLWRATAANDPEEVSNPPDVLPGDRTYEWDVENRLVRALDNSTEVARFTYDGLGRRAEKISGGVTRAYVYDGEDIVEERAGGATTRIVHGPGIDQPLAAVTGSTPAYYLADHLGSIAQHTNSAQQVTLTRTYDPFGNLTSGASSSGYAFTGREWDAEIGLYYYRARYYDAGLGRFISADPIGVAGGLNLYAYVINQPNAFVDPSGHQGQSPQQPSPAPAPQSSSSLWKAGLQMTGDYLAGLSDSLLLGFGDELRNLMPWEKDIINEQSTSYSVGGWSAVGLSCLRAGYVVAVKGYSVLASSGQQASQFRAQMKSLTSGSLTRNVRKPNLSKYTTDDQLRAAAGRTNPYVNGYMAGVGAAGATNGERK